jgi:hypothetical protein
MLDKTVERGGVCACGRFPACCATQHHHARHTPMLFATLLGAHRIEEKAPAAARRRRPLALCKCSARFHRRIKIRERNAAEGR